MKPRVYGLRARPGGAWFYVADCDRCDWSINWFGELTWEWVVASATAHYFLYADTRNCLLG